MWFFHLVFNLVFVFNMLFESGFKYGLNIVFCYFLHGFGGGDGFSNVSPFFKYHDFPELAGTPDFFQMFSFFQVS